MSLSLRDVLADATLDAADPLVLAGRSGLSRSVRWVHTSEVLDIATLLRGGELLLVGGVSLATAGREERVSYVRGLAARGVAGIAIETGDYLATVPDEMVQEATRLDFPLVALRHGVRFVEVTQAINGLLVNESVRRLQLAAGVSHALALGLSNGAELPELMQILAVAAQADTKLTAPGGEVLAEAQLDADEPTPASGAGHVVMAPVSSGGVTVAMLTLTPRPGTSLLLLDAALDRAPESLGLALLRSRPLSRLERDTHEFFAMARSDAPVSPRRLTEVATRLGIARHDAWVTTVARIGPGHALTTGIESALRGSGRTVLSEIDEDLHTCLIALRLSGTTLSAVRQEILGDLRSVALPPHATLAVGPGARSLLLIGHCLEEARITIDLLDGSHHAVADSVALGVPRLVAGIDRHDLVSRFIEEQIGELITGDEQRGTHLFDTLVAYLRHSCNKTETAAALHVQRQSLYQRLDRVMKALARPEPSSDRWAAIMVAVELEAARRQLEVSARGVPGVPGVPGLPTAGSRRGTLEEAYRPSREGPERDRRR